MSILVARRGSLHRATAADYATVVAADSPDSWWRLQETSGTTVADEQGVQDGTVSGGADLNVVGPVDGAIQLDGTDDYIVLDGAEVGNAGSNFTLEAWSRNDGNLGFPVILGTSKSGNNNTFAVIQWSDRKLALAYRGDSGAAGVQVTTTPAEYADNAWHHVVGVREGSTLRIYVDGSQRNSGSFSLNSASADRLTVGALRRSTTGNLLDGGVAEPAVYSFALSAARVADHYAAAP